MRGMGAREVAKAIVKNTKKKVYMTVDLDVLDPAEMPSTGTPEPDGMRYGYLRDIIREVLRSKELIGADFNELCPIPGIAAPNFMAAKLIYNTIGYAFSARRP